MNDEELRIKVAWFALPKLQSREVPFDYFGEQGSVTQWSWVDENRERKDGAIPNYPADLNACAEFEASLDKEQSGNYADHLQDALKVHLVGYTEGEYFNDLKKLKDIICATARQRCEAFIKTMEGK